MVVKEQYGSVKEYEIVSWSRFELKDEYAQPRRHCRIIIVLHTASDAAPTPDDAP